MPALTGFGGTIVEARGLSWRPGRSGGSPRGDLDGWASDDLVAMAGKEALLMRKGGSVEFGSRSGCNTGLRSPGRSGSESVADTSREMDWTSVTAPTPWTAMPVDDAEGGEVALACELGAAAGRAAPGLGLRRCGSTAMVAGKVGVPRLGAASPAAVASGPIATDEGSERVGPTSWVRVRSRAVGRVGGAARCRPV